MSKFIYLAIVVLLFADLTFSSSDPPKISPAPAPLTGADSPSIANSPSSSSSPPAPSTPTSSPSPSPTDASSPFTSPPSSNAPVSSLTPSSSSSPAPAPDADADIGNINHESANSRTDESKKGMSAGKKAGIVMGVMVGAGVVGLAGFVYKKRQDNIRRTQYGLDARSGFL